MEVTQIRDLIAVVDAGSIRSAARAQGVTAPVLTRNVRDLEEELGVQLIERTAHGVLPTAAGKAFLVRSRNVQNELVRMREETAQWAGKTGSVVFGVGNQAFPVIPAALATFRRRFSNADVRMVGGTSVTLIPQLRESELDFALGGIPPGVKDKQIRTIPLWINQRVIVGRRGHPLRNAKSLKELAGADWIIRSGSEETPLGSPVQLIANLFEANGLASPKSVVRCGDSALHLAILAQSDLLSTMDLPQLNSATVRNHLRPINLGAIKPPFSGTVYLYQRADSPLTPLAAAMVAAIKAEARKLAFSASAS